MRAQTLTRLTMLLSVASAAVLMMTACAVPGGMPSEPPVLELPQAGAASAVPAQWWTLFGDPRLNALVDEAVAHNRDLVRAMSRIDEARAALRAAGADRLPRVDLSAASARARGSANLPLPGGIGNDHQLAVGVSYEVDLWARAAKATEAARQELLGTELARETVRSALAAQVVQGYAALQSLDAQRALYGQAVEGQRESVKLQRLRLDAGVIGELDMSQLQAELLANEQQLPRLDRARGEAERALSLLLGRSPREVLEQRVARGPEAVTGAAEVPQALPSDLLQRRPDVVAAEARLRAAGARVDVARAAYFPSVSLTAVYGRESAELSKLMDAPSLVWNVVASLTQPIWDGGRIAAGVDIAKSRRLQAELDYRDAVGTAFKEVADALAAQDAARRTLEMGRERAKQLAVAADLTRRRHEAGEASRLLLIEAERAALAARAENAEIQRSLVASQAELFRALGGGWSAQRAS